MRLTRFYRAYPELNGYSDDECRRLVLLAKVRRDDALWLIPLAWIVLAFILYFPLAFVVIRSAVHAARRSSGSTLRLLEEPVFITSVTGSLALFTIISAVIFIAVRRQLLIRSIRNLINRAACPYCSFSLVGLIIDLGAVVCPECGARVVLCENNITPEDLIPASPTARSPLPARHTPIDNSPIPLVDAPPAPPEPRRARPR